MARYQFVLVPALLVAALLPGCGEGASAKAARHPKVRLGFFANITHAQAMAGLSRGDFQKALGDVELAEPRVLTAGPAAVEALFAGELDLAYMGPSPALNAHIRSRGQAMRIISGSAANGVAIVAGKHSGIKSLADLKGKKLATPQYGNTQDVSARHYLIHKLKGKLKEDGGDTEIFTLTAAEQLSLLRLQRLDACWAAEPWVSRMVHEAGAEIIAEEKDLWEGGRFCSVVLVASADFLRRDPQSAAKFLAAHAQVTAWINANREKAAEIVNEQLGIHAGKKLPPEVLRGAFQRVEFTTDPLRGTIREMAQRSFELGFFKTAPDLNGLFWEGGAP